MYKINKINIKRISPILKDIKYESNCEYIFPETPKLKPYYIDISPDMTKLLLEPLDNKLYNIKLINK